MYTANPGRSREDMGHGKVVCYGGTRPSNQSFGAAERGSLSGHGGANVSSHKCAKNDGRARFHATRKYMPALRSRASDEW